MNQPQLSPPRRLRVWLMHDAVASVAGHPVVVAALNRARHLDLSSIVVVLSFISHILVSK